jgi:hypothetical protein
MAKYKRLPNGFIDTHRPLKREVIVCVRGVVSPLQAEFNAAQLAKAKKQIVPGVRAKKLERRTSNSSFGLN